MLTVDEINTIQGVSVFVSVLSMLGR